MTEVKIMQEAQSNQLILHIKHTLDDQFVRGGNVTLITDKIVNAIVDAVVHDYLSNNTLEIMKQLDTTAIVQLATTKAIMLLTEKIGNGRI